MVEYQENFQSTESCSDGPPTPFQSPPPPPSARDSLRLQRSSVCSRAYFVVVMVFFHLYIINIIALLLYVHYNTGSGEDSKNEPNHADRSSSVTLAPPASGELHSASSGSSGPIFHLPRLEGIRVGHMQTVSLTLDHTHKLRTLSLKPLLFEIPGFLSPEECGVVMQLAQLKGLTASPKSTPVDSQEEQLTQDELFSLLDLNQDGLLQREEILSLSLSNDGSRLSSYNLREIHMGLERSPAGVLSLKEFRQMSGNVFQHGGAGQGLYGENQIRHMSIQTRLFLGEGTHHLLKSIKNRVTRLTRLPSSMIDLSEPLEVVRYEQGGYSNAHHDSGPSNPDSCCLHTYLAANSSTLNQIVCRYVTLLLFLNTVDGGGERSFPMADNRTYEEEALGDLSQQYCAKGNLKIKPVAGTALLWYNHLSDGNGWVGELDEFSLHGDCIVTRGSKWVGSIWINIDPDRQRQERFQRLVSGQPLRSEEHGTEHNDLHQDL
ncbi:transmembrane prolyl 4-hydroxylase [Pygocentrus nattereri]|uniref:Fe2OG dioxygenase domain-containing protein n=1 Tax=Pygocentrus nattereri TaxID=42514 RepID=A0AAR2JYN8_PYGNA|nr:transmembrane prolyl 4-hydroxylase [Pygocentrus nattereri]